MSKVLYAMFAGQFGATLLPSMTLVPASTNIRGHRPHTLVFDDFVREPYFTLKEHHFIDAMQSVGATGDEVRRYKRMNGGARRKFEAEVAARAKSSHPHNAKWRRFADVHRIIAVTEALLK